MKTPGVLLLLLALAGPAASAAGNAFTLYGGFRSGGGFSETGSGEALNLKSGPAAAFGLDLALDDYHRWQLFASHQRSRLKVSYALAAADGSGDGWPLGVSYLHFGGTYFPEGNAGNGVYLVGGLGATLLQLDHPRYGSELRPSLNLGIGYELPLGRLAALRFESRLYSTLLHSSGGLFCSGGCVLSIQGDQTTQGEAMLGFSLPF